MKYISKSIGVSLLVFAIIGLTIVQVDATTIHTEGHFQHEMRDAITDSLAG